MDADSQPLSDQGVREEFGEPRWEFFCEDSTCCFDTYGDESIHQLAIEHAQTTGHVVGMLRKQWGKLRAASTTTQRPQCERCDGEVVNPDRHGEGWCIDTKEASDA